MQPVFHVYDFHYYIFPPGIIRHELPEKNKYCNFKNVETIEFSMIEDYKIGKFANFVQSHYLRNKENMYLPEKANIVPYFSGHNSASFFSFYNEPELLLDTKTNSSIEDNRIVAVITSRPLHIFINNGNKDAFFDAYYVDYLCVDKKMRKNGIAPQIIQTHEYNQRLLNKKIKISLFKREGELTGIVPLCVYSTYGFETRAWKVPPRLPPEYGIVEIGAKNFQHLVDFIKVNNNRFDIIAIPEFSNLIELIKTKNMYCYIVVKDFEVLCAYFFRKSCAFVGKNAEILSCISSINCSTTEGVNIFINGFKIALCKITKKHKNFQFTVIEDIGDNGPIIKNIMLRTEPSIVSPTAYFFYNFAYPTFKSKKVFIVC